MKDLRLLFVSVLLLSVGLVACGPDPEATDSRQDAGRESPSKVATTVDAGKNQPRPDAEAEAEAAQEGPPDGGMPDEEDAGSGESDTGDSGTPAPKCNAANWQARYPSLRGCDFHGASLASAVLAGADLVGADFSGSTLVDVSFDEADLSGADFDQAQMWNVTFAGATLLETKFTPALADRLRALDLKLGCPSALSPDLTCIEATAPDRRLLFGPRVDLHAANLSHLDLRSVHDLSSASLGGADLTGTDLRGVILKYVDAAATSLRDADLSGADLEGAWLSSQEVSGLLARDLVTCPAYGLYCDPQSPPFVVVGPGMDLRGANLSGDNLQQIDLSDSDLSNASLRGADLSHAQLQGTNLNGADLHGAKTLRIASCPDVLPTGGACISNLQRPDETSALLASGAVLDGLYLDGTNGSLEGLDLSEADLRNATFLSYGSQGWLNTRSLNLRGANLSGATLQCDLTNSDLGGADLRNASIVGLLGRDLEGAQLAGALVTLFLAPVLTGGCPASLPSEDWRCTAAGTGGPMMLVGPDIGALPAMDLSGSDFSGAFLASVSVPSETALRSAVFDDGEASLSDLAGNDLSDASFERASVTITGTGVNLARANFDGATVSFGLSSGTLENASFAGASVWGQLIGVDLSGVSFANSNMDNLLAVELQKCPASLPAGWTCLSGAAGKSAMFGPNSYYGAGYDFTGLDFSGMDLAGWDLSGATLDEARFTGASLRGTNLTGASLVEADLQDADLNGSLLRRTDFSGANLAGKNLSGLDFRGVILREANLSYTDLSGADFTDADLSNANLTGALLEGTGLARAILDHADMSGASLLIDTYWWRTHMVDLQGSCPSALPDNWSCAVSTDGRRLLVGAHASLDGADLQGFDLSGTKLAGAYAVHLESCPDALPVAWHCIDDAAADPLLLGPSADLGGVNLSGLDLSAIDLSGANLYEVDLGGTALADTELAGAELGLLPGPCPASIPALWSCRAGAEGNLLFGPNMVLSNRNRFVGVDFSDGNLAGAHFPGNEFFDSNFHGCNLQNADFSGVLAAGADFGEADLHGATLRWLDVNGGSFELANLEGSDLRDARVFRASFDGANLRDVDLRGAFLNEASFDGADMTNVLTDETTTCPDEQSGPCSF